MPCTEAYREHIMYTFNGYCKTVIRHAAITAWRDRSRRRQKEISPEYLTAEKFYPLGTTEAAGGTAGRRARPRFPQREDPQAGGAKDLGASEIEVCPGVAWIDRKYVQEFMYETLRPLLPVPGHQTIYCGGRIVPHHKAVLPRS